MAKKRNDAVLDRLETLLAETEEAARRRDIREIQQLVIGERATGDAVLEYADG